MAYNNVGKREVLTMTGNGEEQPSVEQSEGQLKVDSRDEMYDELVHLQKLFKRGVILHLSIALALAVGAFIAYHSQNLFFVVLPGFGVLLFVGLALWSLLQYLHFAGVKPALDRAEEKDVMITADLFGTYGYRVTVEGKSDAVRTKHVVCRPARKFGVMFPIKPFEATFYVDPQTRKVVVIRTEKCFLWT